MTDELLECFRKLDLQPTASVEDIKQAYREAAKMWHPDRFMDDAHLAAKARERLKEIDEAYDRLRAYMAESGRARPSIDQAQQTKDAQTTESDASDTPPPLPPIVSPPAPPRLTRQPEKSNAGVWWAVFALMGLVILVAIVWSPNDSGKSTPSNNATASGGTDSARAPSVAKALDEKNGFKDFRLGMTLDEAKAVLAPNQAEHNPGPNTDVFVYSGTTVNRIGDFATNELNLWFFESRLYSIEIHFSSFAKEIFEALRINYGEPITRLRSLHITGRERE